MITIEQVNEEIKAGNCKLIYFSSSNLWWTHSQDDVVASTVTGREQRMKLHEMMMKDPAIQPAEKEKMATLMRMVSNSAVTTPLDPVGSPLFQMADPVKWMSEAAAKPAHFGRYKLEAFMKAHAQNCGNFCFSSWEQYALIIDKN